MNTSNNDSSLSTSPRSLSRVENSSPPRIKLDRNSTIERSGESLTSGEAKSHAKKSLRFVLVIPALNEEDAIAATLRVALAARERVLAETPVTEMNVVFVNDGSTDRTHEIVEAPEFDEVIKVRFVENQGYGAAIKAGWRACEGELVGFIDADGTCDPAFSVQLINHLLRAGADVVLAARLNSESEMPLVRRLGNWLFARLLGVVAGKTVSDTASGFRVIRRDRLNLMAPLPDGLHFTPAISCICLLDARLKIEEVPMPYKERVGRSKLSVIRDGIRFLYTIIFSACCYAPLKTMSLASGMLGLLAVLLLGVKSQLGFSDMSTSWFLFSTGIVITLLTWGGVIMRQLNFLLIGPRARLGPLSLLLQSILRCKPLVLTGTTTTLLGVAAVTALAMGPWDSEPGRTYLTMLSVLVITGGVAVILAGVVVRVIWAVGCKQEALTRDEYRVKPLASEMQGAVRPLPPVVRAK